MSTLVYVGTFSRPEQTAGIYVYRMDEAMGSLTPLHTVGGLNSPTWVALHPNGRFLYSVERQGPFTVDSQTAGAITSFAIDPSSGNLTLLNRQSSCGVSPPYVSVHPSGRYAFGANYISGHVCALPIHDDGTLGEATSIVHHEGSGPVPRRQEGPHAHFITPDPTGHYVMACDLGIDKVMIYRFDPDEGKLVPNDPPYGACPPGSGTRHLSFHPSGRFVYAINEIASTMSAFAYDGTRGAMDLIETVPTLPAGFEGTNSTAQIVVHPNGRFVCGSNRGHDSIVIFAIDQDTGRLRLVGHESTQGKTPRNFNIDPTGRFLYAANQDSDTIVTFRIDPDAGTLTATGEVTSNPNPVCVIFRQA